MLFTARLYNHRGKSAYDKGDRRCCAIDGHEYENADKYNNNNNNMVVASGMYNILCNDNPLSIENQKRKNRSSLNTHKYPVFRQIRIIDGLENEYQVVSSAKSHFTHRV